MCMCVCVCVLVTHCVVLQQTRASVTSDELLSKLQQESLQASLKSVVAQLTDTVEAQNATIDSEDSAVARHTAELARQKEEVGSRCVVLCCATGSSIRFKEGC